MGQYFDFLYLIISYDYLCISHIVLVSPFVFFHVYTSDASLLHSPIIIMCSPWCIHFKVSVLRSIHNWVLGSFWIFIIVRNSNCWMYDPLELVLTVGNCALMILVNTLFFPRNSIHDQQFRFLNSWHIVIALCDTSSTAIMAVPPLWNGPSEVVTRLYPVIILLVFNHPSALLYKLYFMGILIQLMFNSTNPKISIP